MLIRLKPARAGNTTKKLERIKRDLVSVLGRSGVKVINVDAELESDRLKIGLKFSPDADEEIFSQASVGLDLSPGSIRLMFSSTSGLK